MKKFAQYPIMKSTVSVFLSIVLLLIPSGGFAGSVTLDGLRNTNSSALQNARDYSTWIYLLREPVAYPGNYGEGFLQVGIVGSVLSDSYIEAGFRTYGNGDVRWYVRTLYGNGIECFAGATLIVSSGVYEECQGPSTSSGAVPNVTPFTWANVEIVTYNQGFWIVRVEAGGVKLDVAKVFEPSNLVDIGRTYQSTRLVNAVGQTGAGFLHWHPRYMIWGSGFYLWPGSSAGDPYDSRNRFS